MTQTPHLPPPALQAVRTLEKAMRLQRTGQFQDAERLFARVVKSHPNYFDAVYLFGMFRFQRGQTQEALSLFTRASALNPRSVDALNGIGFALFELKQKNDSIAAFQRALALDPRDPQTLCNIGKALGELGRAESALDCYDRAIAAQRGHMPSLFNRSILLADLHRHDEALASLDRMIALQPSHAKAHYRRGRVLLDLRRFDAALESFGRADTLQPDFAEAQLAIAMCRLLTGDFARGWAQYEWRWEVEPQKSHKRDFGQPLWRGQDDLAGRTILLHYEQGYGDTIQFCRYVPMVAARGARVVLEVRKSQVGLVAELAGAAQVIAHGEPLPPFDLHCPLASLPLAFGTRLDTIPLGIPYLRASPDDRSRWDVRLGPKSRPRIGVNWAGDANFKAEADRSIGLPRMLPLLSQADVEFVSIQRDLRPGDDALLEAQPNLRHMGGEVGDFHYTAALMDALDLVISSDTYVVHLAGALGKPVWCLLPYTPDWRWMLDRDDSPWYPTMRLFRQPRPGDWDSVIARVREELSQFAASRADAAS